MAFEFAKKAAELNWPFGMVQLALAYRDGFGVDKDQSAADHWYGAAFEALRRLADNGNPSAMESLGRAYQDGHGVSRDYGEAMKWFKLADIAGVRMHLSVSDGCTIKPLALPKT